MNMCCATHQAAIQISGKKARGRVATKRNLNAAKRYIAEYQRNDRLKEGQKSKWDRDGDRKKSG
ncbi:hypothetical protein D0T87_06545 [Bacteroides sp. 51]|nr:hypothetical protein [Bacteroides sp. 51]